MLKMRYCWKKL